MKQVRRDQDAVSRRDFIKAAVGASAASLPAFGAQHTKAEGQPARWDTEADVVVIGAGATGLPAAIQAAEAGASVILIDANTDVGGHAIVSGGNIALGGGTSKQRKYGIVDSPDLLFSDLTDWSVVERNGFPDYRYNDKEVIRAFADESANTYEWLVAHGVIFIDKAPDTVGGNACGNSAPREHHAAAMTWPLVQTGAPLPADHAATSSSGVGLIRPLEASARKLGVQILLQHKMTRIVREDSNAGKVLGISATSQGKTVNIRARKGVIIGTGGHSSNANFRRIFDARLTEEYQVAGEPYSFQDASGEIAAMAVGASLWGAYNQSGEFAHQNAPNTHAAASRQGNVRSCPEKQKHHDPGQSFRIFREHIAAALCAPPDACSGRALAGNQPVWVVRVIAVYVRSAVFNDGEMAERAF